MEGFTEQIAAVLGLCIAVFLTNLIIPICIVGFNYALKGLYLIKKAVSFLRK